MDNATITARRISRRTADALSHDRYAKGQWGACASTLLRNGYTETETEAILRSKLMRWAAERPWLMDASERKARASDLAELLARHPEYVALAGVRVRKQVA